MEILIDERVEILADVQKDELIILTKEVLDQSSLFGTGISTFSVMLPKNVLKEHTCSPTAPYPLDAFYARVYLKDGDSIIGYIDYFTCGSNTQSCEYLAAITTYY